MTRCQDSTGNSCTGAVTRAVIGHVERDRMLGAGQTLRLGEGFGVEIPQHGPAPFGDDPLGAFAAEAGGAAGYDRGATGETARMEDGHQKLPSSESCHATTRWRCSPRPLTPSRISSPGLRKTGAGFCPSPTPGGVPVISKSPG